MKSLFLKIVIFLSPIISLGVVEALLPITYFTTRHFEAVSFKSKVPHQFNFYPNIESEIDAVGDLCHHTDKAIVKKEIWKSDSIGFRNNYFIKKPDILFIGDSFIQGSSLNQNQTISNQLKKELKKEFNNNLTVYNIAPVSFSELDCLLKKNILEKPKLIIFSIVERNLAKPISVYNDKKESFFKNSIIQLFEKQGINVYLDKAFKQFFRNWLSARIQNSKGKGIPAVGDTSMFFLNGINQEYLEVDFQTNFEQIQSYKKYCDSLNIDFLFLPMPNKETVYYELVPFKQQPSNLLNLDSLLKTKNISTINTLQIYNEYRKTHKDLLYHLDDTHWNANAVQLISKIIAKKLKQREYNASTK